MDGIHQSSSPEGIEEAITPVYNIKRGRGNNFLFTARHLPHYFITQYIVEVKKDENREIPLTWHLVSKCVPFFLSQEQLFSHDHGRTKSAARYHTPEIKRKIQERSQCQEALEAAANEAFSSFLKEISESHYAVMRNAVNKLANVDCILSLAHVALRDGYVRPEFTEDSTLEIVEGM